jgi:hypothetical protein
LGADYGVPSRVELLLAMMSESHWRIIAVNITKVVICPTQSFIKGSDPGGNTAANTG